MDIGEIMKQIRTEKGISTYDLSKKTGISQSTISKLENNKRRADIDIIKKIAEALEVPWYKILIGIDRIPSHGEFGEYVKEIRKKKNLSLRQLSDKSHLPVEILSLIEKGEFSVTPKHVKLISIGLNEPYDILINKTGRLDKEDVDVSDILSEDTVKEEKTLYKITDVKQAMEVILSQPGLMLNGEILSDESKIALANAIKMGLAYAEQMQEKEKKNTKEK